MDYIQVSKPAGLCKYTNSSAEEPVEGNAYVFNA